jgi:hypothetical protein
MIIGAERTNAERYENGEKITGKSVKPNTGKRNRKNIGRDELRFFRDWVTTKNDAMNPIKTAVKKTELKRSTFVTLARNKETRLDKK